LGGGEKTIDGTFFQPNIPSEECFTSPMRGEAEGIVYASKPLAYQGQLIENFSVRFHEGKAVEVKAEKGLEALESILTLDEGSAYLGECALVPFDSPINQTGLLFYNTLYDENACCHLALGRGFTDLYPNFEKYTEDQLHAFGINKSLSHVDFMIGTADLQIVGTSFEGKRPSSSITEPGHSKKDEALRCLFFLRLTWSQLQGLECLEEEKIMDFANKKILIAYFSKKGENWYTNGLAKLPIGNTEKMAKLIQKAVGGDLFEIVSKKEYPDGYYACCDVAKVEMKAKARPELATMKDAKSYDVIFVGYPTWWGTLPMPIFTFLDANDFHGKILIPFNTSEGSGFGHGVKDLEKECPGAILKNG
jgi:flavodoxin